MHDKSKLTVIYPQMQQIVNEFPYDDHEFYFLDDSEDIRNDLINYFSIEENKKLIPKNMTLYIGPYTGKKGEKLPAFHSIKGTGEIDKHYASTVKEIAAVTIESPEYQALLPMDARGEFPVRNYEDAVKCNFNISAMNCIHSYKPGMKPKFPVDEDLVPHVEAESTLKVIYSKFSNFFKQKSTGNIPIPKETRVVSESGSSSSSSSVNLSASPSPTYTPAGWMRAKPRLPSTSSSEGEENEAGNTHISSSKSLM